MNIKNIESYFKNISNSLDALDFQNIDKLVERLVVLKNNLGRIFFVGIGGSAANCSHAVNDFRKLCNIDSLCTLDNI